MGEIRMNKEKSSKINKKNNMLIIVGILAMLNFLLGLCPLVQCTKNTIMFFTGSGDFGYITTNFRMLAGLSIIAPHLIAIFLIDISFLLMAIGGFCRNNIVSAIGLVLFGGAYIPARLFDYFSDFIASADWIRFCVDFGDLFRVFSYTSPQDYLRQTNFFAVLLIGFSILFVVILLIMRTANAKKKWAQILGSVLAALATLNIVITGFIDIILLNIRNSMHYSLTERISYLTYFFRNIKYMLTRYFEAGSFNSISLLEPIEFMFIDVFLIFSISIIAISSAVMIIKKKADKKASESSQENAIVGSAQE